VVDLRTRGATGVALITVPGVDKPYRVNLDTYVTIQDAGKALGFEHPQSR
jgi:hypothetical protein